MRGVLKLAPMLVTALLLLCSSVDKHNLCPMFTTDVALTEDGAVVVANKGTGEVAILSADGDIEKRWSFDEPPTGVAVKGQMLFVTSSHAEGFLTCIDLSSGEVKYRVKTAMGACSPVVSKDADKVYVLNRYKGTVS